MEELFIVFCKSICALHFQHCSWYRCDYTWQKFGMAIHKCSHWGKHTIHCHTRPYLSSDEHPKLKMLQRCVINPFDHLTSLILEKHKVDWNYKIAFKMSKFSQSFRRDFQIKYDSSLQLAHKEQGKRIIDIWYIIYFRVDFTRRCAWACHHVRLKPQWENYGTKAWETNFSIIRQDDPHIIT